MSVGALTESGDTVTADVTTNGSITATGTFTPAGEVGEEIAVTVIDNSSVSTEITARMRSKGGVISITVVSANDNTKTDTVTYDVAKVYAIELAELSKVGDIVSGSITTNDTAYTPAVTLDGTDVDPSLITVTSNSISVDVTGLTGLLSITVTCDTDSTKSDTKTFTLI